MGILYRDGRTVSHATMGDMLSRISHRGPDGQGIWCADSVGLAQCMRRSTPESVRERQPHLSRQADLVLVADARIDNREWLINALALKDRPAEEVTDTQLILNAYKNWGEACPDKLEGDFAFAIWDSHRKVLFCARDTAGVKPFYYYLSRKCMAFASEIKALLALSEMPRGLNETKVAEYLLWNFEDTRQTFYQDIYRLPPACSLTISFESERLQQYWNLDPTKEIRYRNSDDYVLEFRELFNQAVRYRTRSVYQIGSTLSGGLDSSSIATTALKYLPKANSSKLKVFSAIFPDLDRSERFEIDERNYVDKMLEVGQFDPVFINASNKDLYIDREKLPAIFDEPYFAPSLYLFWEIYSSARDAGVHILLDGTDGDRTISNGQEYLVDLAKSFRWIHMWNVASAVNKEQDLRTGTYQTMWRLGFRALIPHQIFDLKRRLTGNQRPAIRNRSLINPQFAHAQGIDDRLDTSSPSIFDGRQFSRYKHWQEMTSGVNALSLELFDKAAAFHNISVRFPFYDRQLIEFCLALPPEQKLNKGRTRYILRAAMDGVLPPQVQWRTSKSNLGLAFSRQFSGIQRSLLNRMVYTTKETLGAYIDRAAVDQAYHRLITNPTRSINDAYMIFGASILADWFTEIHH